MMTLPPEHQGKEDEEPETESPLCIAKALFPGGAELSWVPDHSSRTGSVGTSLGTVTVLVSIWKRGRAQRHSDGGPQYKYVII